VQFAARSSCCVRGDWGFVCHSGLLVSAHKINRTPRWNHWVQQLVISWNRLRPCLVPKAWAV